LLFHCNNEEQDVKIFCHICTINSIKMKKTTVISPGSVVVRNDNKFMISPIGDEIVMMSMENGNYIGINSVGASIWEKLEQPTPVNELVNYLVVIYDIHKDECEQKTIKYLYDMLDAEMLTVIS